MGRAKKPKKQKTSLADYRMFNSKLVMRKKEMKLVKPGHFNVYSQNWIIGN